MDKGGVIQSDRNTLIGDNITAGGRRRKRRKSKRRTKRRRKSKKRRKPKRKSKLKKRIDKAGSLRKSKLKKSKISNGRFILKRKTEKSRDRSLQRKFTLDRATQQKKLKTMKRRKEAFSSKTHTLPASVSATGSPTETLIKWRGHRNKMGKKMYSIYDSHLLNIDPTDKSALIDGLYYVKGKNNKKGTYTSTRPSHFGTRNIKSRSRTKSPKGFGFSIR